MTATINCKECGREHHEQTANCAWIDCGCGEDICGQCGSSNLGQIAEHRLDLSDGADDNYWCTKECKDCDHQGCGMCV